MEYSDKNPVIIAIAGRARSGKSSIGKNLKKLYEQDGKKGIILEITRPLKYYIEQILEHKIDEKKKPRQYLQKISSNLIKEKLGFYDLFIQREIEDICVFSYFKDVIIIPDIRFPKEIDTLRKNFKNVFVVLVVSDKMFSDLTEEEMNDITEVSMDGYLEYDYLIQNEPGVDLEKVAIDIKHKIEKER